MKIIPQIEAMLTALVVDIESAILRKEFEVIPVSKEEFKNPGKVRKILRAWKKPEGLLFRDA